MKIGSAIERGSFIFAYDEHGITLFSKAKDQAPRTDCWDSPVHRHRTVRLDHLLPSCGTSI